MMSSVSSVMSGVSVQSQQLPPPVDPVLHFLALEWARVKPVVARVRDDLAGLRDAAPDGGLRYRHLLSTSLLAVATALRDNRVPQTWAAALHPLTHTSERGATPTVGDLDDLTDVAAWLRALLARVAHLRTAAAACIAGQPHAFCMAAFLAPAAFVQAVRARCAETHTVPSERIVLRATILNATTTSSGAATSTGPALAPDGSITVCGLALYGALWDSGARTLTEATVGWDWGQGADDRASDYTRLIPLPPVLLQPFVTEGSAAAASVSPGHFGCPLFCSVLRSEEESLLTIELPTGKLAPDVWLGAGVAAVLKMP
jgi:hypothetical protein